MALHTAPGSLVLCDTREPKIVPLALGISGDHYYASQPSQKFSDYVRRRGKYRVGWMKPSHFCQI